MDKTIRTNMKPNAISILCSTDNNYVPYCGIMLTSLFETNKEENFDVYLLTDHLEEKSIQLLKCLASIYGNNIYIKQINKEIVKKFPLKLSDHVSLATYYRLFAPAFIPRSIEKVIYLDCDMIVNGSLSILWNQHISKYAIGAVTDEDYVNEEKFHRLNYHANFGYFNAGMLLINLNYWRENHVMERCLQYITDTPPERLLFHDQDVLNAVLHKEKKALSLKYNLQTGFLTRKTVLTSNILDEVSKTINDAPIIIHYTGPNKPWFPYSQHPYTEYFLYYKRISLWNDLVPKIHRSLKDTLLRWRNNVIWAVGIKPRPQTYIIKRQKCQKILL